MNIKSLGFIGGGRITKIILQAFKNKKIVFERIIVHDNNPEISRNLKQLFPRIEISGIEQCSAQDVVFIALHPPTIPEILEKIAPFVSAKTLIISLAPKIKIACIIEKVKSTSKIVRLIPNATSVINEGYNPVCLSGSISGHEKREIFDMLGILGNTIETAEHKLEAYAIISAMAPTYFWFQWKKLGDLAIEIGMTKAESDQTVYQTMISALNTQFRSGLTDQDVFDLIPVKPLYEHEDEIRNIFDQNLKGLYNKLIS
jgi:pyrroline-5-carboxylate reductase